MKHCATIVLVLSAFVHLAAATQNEVVDNHASRMRQPAHIQRLRVAFVLSDDAVMIDFAGPWEVFQDVMVPSRGVSMEDQHPFELYTVAESTAALRASDGMRIVPDHTFDDAPAPDIVVVPAQSGRSPKMLAWLRTMSTKSDVVMSVCTGAFVLADAGLLNGKHATTHHSSYDRLQQRFPQISVERGMRYVQADAVIFTAGGLSAGIDLALHIVELYFGRDAAQATANTMEYEGTGWKGDGRAAGDFPSASAPIYASDATADGPLGRWDGAIRTADGDYHIVLHVWRDKGGQIGGALDSVDQQANGLALAQAVVRDSVVRFSVPAVMGTFEGTLKGSMIRGTWTQHGVSVPVELARSHAPSK